MKLCIRNTASGSAKQARQPDRPERAGEPKRWEDLHAADMPAADDELQQRHDGDLERYDLEREDGDEDQSRPRKSIHTSAYEASAAATSGIVAAGITIASELTMEGISDDDVSPLRPTVSAL